MADIKICDRCGASIEKTYFEIDIHAYDVNPSGDGRVSSETFAHNCINKSQVLFYGERSYCKSCTDKIKNFMFGKEDS